MRELLFPRASRFPLRRAFGFEASEYEIQASSSRQVNLAAFRGSDGNGARHFENFKLNHRANPPMLTIEGFREPAVVAGILLQGEPEARVAGRELVLAFGKDCSCSISAHVRFQTEAPFTVVPRSARGCGFPERDSRGDVTLQPAFAPRRVRP